MIATIDSLFNEALTLPDESRLQLVERLIPTIAGDSALEAEQLAEASRDGRKCAAGRCRPSQASRFSAKSPPLWPPVAAHEAGVSS